MKKLNMDAVLAPDTSGFRLVERSKLLAALRSRLKAGCIEYECAATQVVAVCGGGAVFTSEGTIDNTHRQQPRVIVGADGIRSVCRQYVTQGNDTPTRSVVVAVAVAVAIPDCCSACPSVCRYVSVDL